MTNWNKPLSGDELAGKSAIEVMPAREDLPQDFRVNWHSDKQEWCRFVSGIFYNGGKFLSNPKDGINKDDARIHFQHIISSWEPSHEHKTGGAAYLLSLWFKDLTV